MSLTPQQTRFVAEYLLDLNATAAYKRAGYKAQGRSAENAASRLLGNDGVQAAIKEAIEKREKRTEVDQDYVIKIIRDTIERCQQAAPVLDRQGKPVMTETPAGDIAPAYEFQAMAVLKGAELLGRHLKMFTDKTELTGKDGKDLPGNSGVLMVPGAMSVEEWEKQAKGHAEGTAKA